MNRKLTFALYIMTFCIVSTLFGINAKAAPQLDVNVQTGLEDIQKAGKALPVTFDITNNGSDFNGTVSINAAFDVVGGNAITQKLTLKTGESKKVHFLLDEYAEAEGDNRLTIYEGDSKSGKKLSYTGNGEVPSSKLDEGQLAVFSLDFPKNKVDPIKSAVADDEQMVYKNLEGFEAPTDSKEYDAISLMMIQSDVLKTWSEEQQQALVGWLYAGGTLYIEGNHFVPKKIEQYKPLKIAKETKKISNQEANKLFRTEQLKFDLTLNNNALTEKAKTVIGDKETTLIAKKMIGKGAIVQSSFQSVQNNQEVVTEIMNKIFDQIAMQDETMYGNSFSQLGDGTKAFPAFHFSIATLSAIIFFYILIIGPLLYFVLKRKDKREYAWWIIPIGAALTAITIFAISSKGRLTQSKAQLSSIVQITDHQADAYFTQSVLTNTSDDLKIEAPKSVYMTQMKNFSKVTEVGKTAVLEEGKENNTLNILDTRYWGVTSIAGKYSDASFGKMDIQIGIQKGVLKGTIKNNLAQDLHDVEIWSGYKKYKVGNIKKGETVKVNQKVKEQFLAKALAKPSDDLFKPSEKEELSKYQKETIKQAALNNLISGDQPIVAGWSDEEIIPLRYDGLKVAQSNQNLIIQDFDQELKIDGPFTVQDQSLQPGITDLTGSGYADITDESYGWMVDEGRYEISYALPTKFPVDDVKWASLQFRYTPTSTTKMKVYNFKDSKYEKLEKKQTVITKNIENYISQNGSLLFHLERNSVDDPTMRKPMLQLKGASK